MKHFLKEWLSSTTSKTVFFEKCSKVFFFFHFFAKMLEQSAKKGTSCQSKAHYDDRCAKTWLFMKIISSRKGKHLWLFFSFLNFNFSYTLKLSCDSRFQQAITACSCVFKVITLVWANQRNFFENATTCSKRMRKTLVATQLKTVLLNPWSNSWTFHAQLLRAQVSISSTFYVQLLRSLILKA